MNSEDLPIFKSAYDLLERLIELTKEMPRMYRYSLGGRLTELCLDLLGLVYRANMSQEGRVGVLTDLLIDYRQLQMLLRVCYRQKLFSSGRYAEMISLLDTIGRQATGWRKKTLNEQEK